MIKTGRHPGDGGMKRAAGSLQGGLSMRLLIIGVAGFLIGVGGGFYFFHKLPKSGVPALVQPQNQPQPAATLSAQTRAFLAKLNVPVEIRFYSVLDDQSLPVGTVKYAGRIDGLLRACEREGGGKIKVVRYKELSSSTASAAAADGHRPFNADRGSACFFGLTVSGPAGRETVGQLAPEWEPAFEFDLCRAIARVTSMAPAGAPVDAPQNTEAVEALRGVFPDLTSVSVEEGTRLLREKALQEFKLVTQEFEARMRELERQLAGGAGNSRAELEAVRIQMQQTQKEQTERLQAIATRLQEQIAALEQVKRQ